MQELTRLSAQLRRRIEKAATIPLWCGRPVRVVDGTCFSMPDTPENQKAFPQSHQQQPGCGFPIVRAVALFSLATGSLLGLTWGVLRTGELELFRQLWTLLRPGDVLLGDRLFCTYLDLFRLRSKGIDSVMRKHQRRTKSVREVQPLGLGDRLVDWIKMKPCPKGLTPRQWKRIPQTLRLREVFFTVTVPGFRSRTLTLATTLLDPQAFPAEALIELYRRRWMAELFFKDIKISLGMDILHCKSPQMIEKEIWMFVIAYNLIRALMLEAAKQYEKDPLRLSFKGTLSTLRQWTPLFVTVGLSTIKRRALIHELLNYLARDPVPLRPHRNEPRAIKRRKKNFQLLTQPRQLFKECLHRNKYQKPLS